MWRGGSFDDNINNCRCAFRNNNQPDIDDNNIGFRVVAHTSQPPHAGNAGRPRSPAEAWDEKWRGRPLSMSSQPLYPQVYDWSNLLLAARNAARGKRGRGPASAFEVDLADQLLELADELRHQTYRPGPYESFFIHEPKRRLVSAASFRDRVVHHALCNVIEPVFERGFIADSFANRKGKGTHRAIDRCQYFARRYLYVLICDVRQHFPAIDHEILMERLGAKISDPQILWLCRRILESGVGVLDDQYDMVYFPGDDLFAVERPRGLPIGNLTSQFWSNCYLDPLDHFVKRQLRCHGYSRYVDDFLLFADDKATLWRWKSAVVDRLARLRLTLHEDRTQVRPVTAGIPWLGFVIFPTHRRLKRRNVVGYRRRLAGLLAGYRTGDVNFEQLKASWQGWAQHAAHGNTVGLRRAVLGSIRLPGRQPGPADPGRD